MKPILCAGLGAVLALSATCAAAEGKTRLYWSSAGEISGLHCTQVHESAAPASYTWNDNYLCANRDLGLRWSSAGPIAGMRCTQVHESAEPAQYTWNDNYLCLPPGSPVSLRWSSAGAVAGMDCVQVHEGRDPHTWHDNYLCYRQPVADLLTITKIHTVKPASGLDDVGRGVFAVIGAAVQSAGEGGVSLGSLYNGAKYGVQVGEYLDRQFSDQDDLIVKIDGRPYLPVAGAAPYHAMQGGQIIYPNLRASINGAGMLQLIEWDSGSDNGNLGVLIIVGGRSYTAEDVIILSPEADERSIYAVSYRVDAGMGDPDAVVDSMLCGTNQCDDCQRLDCRGQPYGALDRDGDYDDLLPCPPHFRHVTYQHHPQALFFDDVYLRVCQHLGAR